MSSECGICVSKWTALEKSHVGCANMHEVRGTGTQVVGVGVDLNEDAEPTQIKILL